MYSCRLDLEQHSPDVSPVHFPLTASLVLTSAALPALITADNPTRVSFSHLPTDRSTVF